MSAQSGRDLTVTHSSKMTLGMLVVILGGIAALWQRTVAAAAEDAAWRARLEEHQRQCELGIVNLGERFERIENRVAAYESWPKTQK